MTDDVTTLPGGAYDALQKVGWKVNGTTSKFTYKNSGNPTPLIDGINKFPQQLTHGEGPARGKQVEIDITFNPPIFLPATTW